MLESQHTSHLMPSLNLYLGKRLTRREVDVFYLLIDGLPNKLIADRLGLSCRTVETHRAHIFKKFNVRNVASLYRELLKLNIH